MNHLIRELAEQAGMNIFNRRSDGLYVVSEAVFQRFAEMIVCKCVSDLKERIATRYEGDEKDRHIGYGMEIVYFDIIDRFVK